MMYKKHLDKIEVYTDGSCIGNTNKKLRSCGYGIHWANGELDDISEKYTFGNATNNRAELFAIHTAIKKIQEVYTYHKIYIYTDSEYCIKSLTKYAPVWEKNGWKTANNKNVENQDILKNLYDTVKCIKDKIVFVHVRAHTGNNDVYSINNDIADKLAKAGAMRKHI